MYEKQESRYYNTVELFIIFFPILSNVLVFQKRKKKKVG